MIKKLILAALLAVPMCFSAQAQKFGTINSTEIYNLMPEKATAEATLKTVSDKYQQEYQNLQTEFEKKYKDFQALGADTPQTIKDRRMQELQENQQKIQTFQETASQDIQKQQQALLAPIQDKINKAIQAVGAEGGFTFIYDLAVPAVVFTGNGATDVSALVKAKLGIK
ncbi:MAG: OmpH family outer membrane protein [Muribaculaceae bacterium]|jgi:outer membrane protein|nr:OmpH family outer membrane protein [Muribaculaceae bacterium]